MYMWQAKSHLSASFETRAVSLREKYAKLRKLLESSHEQSDDALAKHQAFLQEHYTQKFEEKYGSLEAQAEQLEVCSQPKESVLCPKPCVWL